MNIERKALASALEPLKPAIASRTAIVAYTHLWFDGAYAYAHDGGMGCRVKFQTEFKCGVPGSLLLGLINQATTETVDLTASENDTLVFKSGRAQVKLATMSINQKVWPYPVAAEGQPVTRLKLTADFVKALKRVFVVHPSSPKRMEHYSVCMFPFDDKEMDMYVTDSRSLAFMSVKQRLVGVDTLALPRTFAEQLVSQCKEDAELSMYEDHFAIQASDTVSLYSNVFDTSEMLDLPGFADKYINEREAPPFPVPDDMREALERAVLLAGSEESVVKLKTSDKRLLVVGRYPRGEMDEEFDTGKALPKCTLSVAAKTVLGVRDVDRMMVSPGALVLRGADGFLFILAPYAETAPQQ